MQIVQGWGIAPLTFILFILSPTEKKQEKAAASPGELYYDPARAQSQAGGLCDDSTYLPAAQITIN